MARELKVRTRNAGTMTEAAMFGWIRSILRRSSLRWKPIYEALNDAKYVANPGDISKWGGRIKYLYHCASCQLGFPRKAVEVDHVTPCGSIQSFADIGPFVERMLCEKEGLRILCKACHQRITNAEKDKIP